MRKMILALCAFGLFGQNAFASMQLGLASGGTTLIIDDNIAPDANITAGQMVYSNSNFNSWNIVVTAAESRAPSLNPFGLDLAVLATCTSGNCTTQDLFVATADTAFTQITASFNTSFSTTQVGGTSQQWAYQNGISFGTSVPAGFFATIGPFTGTNAGTAAGGGPKGPSAYTLVLLQRYHGIGSFSSDGNITGVPEPGGILLLGSGLLFAGAALRRKLQSRG